MGRYRLVRRIGAGGMAEIWKAKVSGPAGFEKVLAIKRILPQHTADEDFVDMFIEEAKLAAQLHHPNIVQVFDFGMSDEQDYFIAMEYVAGPNLSALQKRLRKAGVQLPMEVALYIVQEACKGLAHAHVARDGMGRPLGLIHRDVSPQNLLISYGGEVKITDFGIAKVADAATRTTEGQVRGKLSYMSPEQARVKPLDHRSDIFSLGVVLYDLITGDRLFSGRTSQEVFASVMNFTQLTQQQLSAIPPAAHELLKTALAIDIEARYQSATQMEMAISGVLGPNGAVQARSMLGSLVQRNFSDEYSQETSAHGETEVGLVTKVSETSSLKRVQGNRDPTKVEDHQPITMKETARSTPAPETAPPRETGGSRRPTGLLVGLLVLALLAGTGYVFRAPLLASLRTALDDGAATPTAVADASSTMATPAPTPAPTRDIAASTPTPRATRRARRTPRSTPTPRPVAAKGTLVIKAVPWANVWIDGKKKTQAAPVGRYTLSAGTHSVRFQNPALKSDFKKSVRIKGNQSIELKVIMRNKTVRLD